MVQRCLYSYRQRYSSSQLWWRISLSIRERERLAFFTPMFKVKKRFTWALPRSWHKERANVIYNFFAIWLVYFPKCALLIGYYSCVTHWHEHRCQDYYRQWQISQSDCKFTSNCGENFVYSNISKTSASVLPWFPNTRKLMNFIVFECFETPVKHEARVFEMASQSAPNCKQESKNHISMWFLLSFV